VVLFVAIDFFAFQFDPDEPEVLIHLDPRYEIGDARHRGCDHDPKAYALRVYRGHVPEEYPTEDQTGPCEYKGGTVFLNWFTIFARFDPVPKVAQRDRTDRKCHLPTGTCHRRSRGAPMTDQSK